MFLTWNMDKQVLCRFIKHEGPKIIFDAQDYTLDETSSNNLYLNNIMIILQQSKIYYHQICIILRHKEDDFTNQTKAGERKMEEHLKSKKRNTLDLYKGNFKLKKKHPKEQT